VPAAPDQADRDRGEKEAPCLHIAKETKRHCAACFSFVPLPKP
jgi:hypothetical protein